MEVSLYCDTVGATIYYTINTINGDTPTENSTKYTGPFTLTGNVGTGEAVETKVRAYAVKTGMTNSAEMTAQTYTVTPAYTVTVDGINYGSFTKDKEIAIYPQTAKGTFTEWTSSPANLTITDNKFTMPASNVVITGVYKTAVRAVDLKLNQPVQGGSPLPTDLTTKTVGVSVNEFNLTPSATSGTAEFNTAYTITAKLTIRDTSKYVFGNTVAVNISGTPVTAVKNDDGTYNITYTVKTGKNKITGVTDPVDLTGIANGTSMADILEELPDIVTVQTQAGDKTLTVLWDANPVSGSYDPTSSAAQNFTLRGVLRTDADLENTEGLCAQVNVSVNASAVPTSYRIEIVESEHGTVTSNRNYAYGGTTITLTVSPDEGYELDELTVTDASGKAIAVTDKEDGTYTFKLPYGNVKVAATFVATEPEPEPDPVKDCAKDENCPAAKFTDVKMDWTHDGIHFCVENGLMNGTGDDTFEPEGTAARAMLVTVLYRLEGEPEVGECTFSDVPANQWYTNAIIWAAENGIVEGYDGKFQPTDDITREAFATILYRYAVYKGYDVSVGEETNILSFEDAEEIHSWALDAMQWAVGAGLFEGKGENNLDPTGKATRAEMAAILYRFCENVAE